MSLIISYATASCEVRHYKAVLSLNVFKSFAEMDFCHLDDDLKTSVQKFASLPRR